MVACICCHKSEEWIREKIREGFDTVEKLRDEGCSLGCQMCVPYVEQYIEEELSQETEED